MRYLVGVDIGGMSVKLGLIASGDTFTVVRQGSIETHNTEAPELLTRRIAEAVRELVHGAGDVPVFGVGVGCPGLIDPWNGVVRTAPNLKTMVQFPLRDSLAKELEMPVEIQNDANAAMLGEYLFSPESKDVRNMVLLTLGTGIGGGVVCDGHLLVGADNAATELGHIKVEYQEGALCGCGRRGCVEAYAGAGGVAKLAQKALAGGRQTMLRPETLSTREIAEAAGSGDVVALEILRQVGQYLGRAISDIIEIFNPEKVVLGGGASAAIDFLRPGIDQALDEFSSFPFTRQRCQIERSAFPDDINVIGAAATFLNGRPAR